MSGDLVASVAWEMVKLLLDDWPAADQRRYFELAYRDVDMELYVRTDSSLAAQRIAESVGTMIVERMKLLRAREERRLLRG